MNTQLLRAKTILEQSDCTCVLLAGDEIFTSHRRGVAPLLGWLEEGNLKPGFFAADKVVGRATAYLYCLLGARAVYAGVISEAAMGVFSRYGIHALWDQQVPYIRNRAGDGMCPMEAATLNVHTPEDALAAVKKALAELDKRV